ncbi:MAG: metalloregulator ArsR/SmtB family transcription factor [Terrimesophilobacter sp.]
MSAQLSPPTSPAFVNESASAFLKALASETRQQIMFLFTTAPRLSVGEVAELAGLSQSTASAHLAELRRGGLLQSTRDGKTVHYRIDADAIARHLDQIKSFLACCCAPEDVTTERTGS